MGIIPYSSNIHTYLYM